MGEAIVICEDGRVFVISLGQFKRGDTAVPHGTRFCRACSLNSCGVRFCVARRRRSRMKKAEMDRAEESRLRPGHSPFVPVFKLSPGALFALEPPPGGYALQTEIEIDLELAKVSDSALALLEKKIGGRRHVSEFEAARYARRRASASICCAKRRRGHA
jgi:hypothetical protein